MAKTLIIVGSARSDGNTMQAVQQFVDSYDAQIIDLRKRNIGYFDYDNKADDDFIAIAEAMTKADKIIFATPVYWYSMSAVMKTFFDRFTDLITVRKDLGRKLEGRECYVIATGAEEKIPEGFEKPFSATCDYFNMQYKACLYLNSGDNVGLGDKYKEVIKVFAREVFGK